MSSPGPNPQFESTEQSYWLATEKTFWLDRLTAVFSDWINPIVVKETRQSLKSRQFALTFFLTLMFGLAYSLLAVLFQGGGTYPGGNEMIIGYIWILAFPLVLVVPFFTFRSMVSEGEDRTYELLAITSLKPRQIIWGKLASGLLQILIYVSAISPCIVFTYMLREISLSTIFFILFSIVFSSVAFCIVGLFLATVSQVRALQILISVIMIFGLGWCYIFGCIGLSEMAERDAMSRIPRQAIVGMTGMFLIPATYVALLFAAATARLKFLSDNRSTALRIMLLIQQVFGVGWLLWILMIFPDDDLLYVGIAVVFNHWLFIGAIILGERREMSERVRRALPKDTLSQIFFSWLVPGPGRGYLFVLGNLVAFGVLMCGFVAIAVEGYFDWVQSAITSLGGIGRRSTFSGQFDLYETITFCSAWLIYVVAFLSITRIIVELSRNFIPASQTQVFSFFLLVLLIGALVAVPLIIQTTFFWRGLNDDYSLLQFSNMYWTTSELEVRSFNSSGIAFQSVIFMFAISVLLLLYTLIAISAKLNNVPSPVPERLRDRTNTGEPEREFDPFVDDFAAEGKE